MAPATTSPRNLLTSLILVFPLFLVYQVGVIFTLPMLNGADFLTIFLIRNVGLSQAGYLGFTGGVALLFAVTVAILRRRQRFDATLIGPVLLESAIYALTMGSLIVFVMTKMFGISPRLAAGDPSLADGGFVTRLIMSIGAGVWEETVFRLGLLAGIALVLEKAVGMRRWLALTLALVLSSLAFSAMHHIGPLGDPLKVGVFTFRFLAGMFFGLLFWMRGFAVAVYTHALYDIYVLVIR